MAIAFRGLGASEWHSLATNLLVNRPAGLLSGDVVLAAVCVNQPSVVLTPPDGTWTLIRRVDGTNFSAALYRKLAGGSEPAQWTFTSSANTNYVTSALAYSGVDAAGPVNVESGTLTAATTTPATPSVTTTVDGARLVTLFACRGGGAASFTPPAGMSERVDDADLGSNTAQETADVAQASAAAVSKSATSTQNTAHAALIVALKPAPLGGKSKRMMTGLG